MSFWNVAKKVGGVALDIVFALANEGAKKVDNMSDVELKRITGISNSNPEKEIEALKKYRVNASNVQNDYRGSDGKFKTAFENRKHSTNEIED